MKKGLSKVSKVGGFTDEVLPEVVHFVMVREASAAC